MEESKEKQEAKAPAPAQWVEKKVDKQRMNQNWRKKYK